MYERALSLIYSDRVHTILAMTNGKITQNKKNLERLAKRYTANCLSYHILVSSDSLFLTL